MEHAEVRIGDSVVVMFDAVEVVNPEESQRRLRGPVFTAAVEYVPGAGFCPPQAKG